eukprot:gene1978-biopygen1867
MQRLWLLLDLYDIELQARYIRSKANEWADRLSRCEDINNWRLNRRWFKWADGHWGPHTVDRFASEISAQLPSGSRSCSTSYRRRERLRRGAARKIEYDDGCSPRWDETADPADSPTGGEGTSRIPRKLAGPSRPSLGEFRVYEDSVEPSFFAADGLSRKYGS